MLPLLLIFIVVPVLELSLLLQVGTRIGLPGTLLLVLGTGVLGASLARQQGLAVVSRLQAQLKAGQVPGEALLEGLLIFVAGLVLITPGLITDALGLLCLLPVTRRPILAWLRRGLQSAVATGRVRVHQPTEFAPDGRPIRDRTVIVHEPGSEPAASADGPGEQEPDPGADSPGAAAEEHA